MKEFSNSDERYENEILCVKKVADEQSTQWYIKINVRQRQNVRCEKLFYDKGETNLMEQRDLTTDIDAFFSEIIENWGSKKLLKN